MTVDYALIGSITRDQTASGWQIGGTVWYSGHAAQRWGARTGIVTSCPTSLPLDDAPGLLCRLPSLAATTFANTYQADQRTQRLLAHATPLAWAAIPPAWLAAPILHLAPVAHELPALPERRLARGLIGVTPQGWMRTWGADQAIQRQDWQPTPAQLRCIDVLVISSEDSADADLHARAWSRSGPVVAVTQGSQGVHIWQQGACSTIAAVPAAVVDPTGAGDVWAAALFWQLHLGQSLPAAARWACAAATCAIEGQGIATLADSSAINHRLLSGTIQP